jgi:hypothetical protein
LTLKVWNVVGTLETARGTLQNALSPKSASWADFAGIKSKTKAESTSPEF